jgi:hypothetical protein
MIWLIVAKHASRGGRGEGHLPNPSFIRYHVRGQETHRVRWRGVYSLREAESPHFFRLDLRVFPSAVARRRSTGISRVRDACVCVYSLCLCTTDPVHLSNYQLGLCSINEAAGSWKAVKPLLHTWLVLCGTRMSLCATRRMERMGRQSECSRPA